MLRALPAVLCLALLAACEETKPPAPATQTSAPPPGRLLFVQYTCNGCHSLDGSRLAGPTLKGLFGSKRTLADGSVVLANEAYLRESIVDPNAKVAQGYPAVMPSFRTLLTDAQLDALVAYLAQLR